MAIIMDGKALAEKIKNACKYTNGKVRLPVLTVCQVGNDPASDIYVRNKEKACREAGIIFLHERVPEYVEQPMLEAQLRRGSKEACMLQLPIPQHLDANKAIDAIEPFSDVDGLHPRNMGLLMQGRPFMIPCTAKGILRLLKEYQVPLDGKHAVIVGRSNIVGKPTAMLLLNENCTVTICHSHTENLASITKQADILVVAVGKAKLITADMVKPGAAVIDVGINRVDGQVIGDVDFENVEKVAGWITPVPGGVGPMTVAMLLENTVQAAEQDHWPW